MRILAGFDHEHEGIVSFRQTRNNQSSSQTERPGLSSGGSGNSYSHSHSQPNVGVSLSGLLNMSFMTHNISDWKRQRRQVGWCAQADILFEQLSVMENLVLFHSLQEGYHHRSRHRQNQNQNQNQNHRENQTQGFHYRGLFGPSSDSTDEHSSCSCWYSWCSSVVTNICAGFHNLPNILVKYAVWFGVNAVDMVRFTAGTVIMLVMIIV